MSRKSEVYRAKCFLNSISSGCICNNSNVTIVVTIAVTIVVMIVVTTDVRGIGSSKFLVVRCHVMARSRDKLRDILSNQFFFAF